MYNQYFGFKEAPFSIAPDPRYLYMTAQHREALAHLVYGLNSEGGCILLTGEVGTGKTTICRCLLEQIPEQAKVALVLNPKVSEVELLETICDELKISYPATDNSLKTYTDKIYAFLIESNRKNEKTVLIIDEAQNLSSPVLEQLRLLTNLETNQRKLLQIIILGQPELLDILSQSEMRQLAQRITARFHLKPLSKDEVKAYVSHRLAIAGQNIQLFPENSIKLLFKLSNGIPRLINVLCDRALLGAYVESQNSVNPAIIKKAATEVFGELKNIEDKNRFRRWLYPVVTVSGIALLASALILYYITQPQVSSMALTDNTAVNEQATLSVTPVEDKNETDIQPLSSSDQAPESLLGTLIEQFSTDPEVATTDSPDTADKNPTAATQYDDIKDILNDDTNSNISAYQALFELWGQNYNINISDTACKQASANSLGCLYKQGNLNNLKAHDRPAVLTLVSNDGSTRYITVASIHDDYAKVFFNNREYKIKLSDLDKYWYGQFVLLWKKPADYSSAITPGDKGKIINWLRSHFETKKTAGIDKYDANLVSEVKSFQSQHGLTADGIVGPVTIIHLNTQSGLAAPTLSKHN
jgi:general secretion pathway protein A